MTENYICFICRDEEIETDFETSCKHHFHLECIMIWWMKGTDMCPYCTKKIFNFESIEGYLMERFPELPVEEKRSFFIYSILKQNMSLFNLISKHLDTVNFFDVECKTPIHYSCVDGNLEMLNALVSLGGDVDLTHEDYFPPIYYSCGNGMNIVFDRLVELGADLQCPRLLLVACANGHVDIVTRLIDLGVDIDYFDDECEESPLILACRNGFINVVKVLLERGAKPYSDEFNPLIEFVKTGNVETISWLIEFGLEIDKANYFGMTALRCACEEGQYEVFEKLIELGADFRESNSSRKSKTLLMFACVGGNMNILNRLIELGVDINESDILKRHPIHFFCQYGTIEFIERLVQAGADLDCKHKNGFSTSFYACVNERKEVFDFFLARGNLDVNERSNLQGLTPIHLASRYSSANVICRLVSAGADVNSRSKCGELPIFEACHSRNYDAFEALIDLGANTRLNEGNGGSLLQSACRDYSSRNVRFLLENGWDVNEKTLCGLPLLHLAYHNDLFITFDLFIERGADINATDSSGLTLLHKVCQLNSINCFNRLVNLGASINYKNNAGETPFYHLCRYGEGDMELFERFVELGAAELNSKNFHVACWVNSTRFVDRFLELGVDVNVKSECGETALFICINSYSSEIFEKLIESGADVNIVSSNGNTLIHVACLARKLYILQRLIDLKCIHINSKNENGETPLQILCKNRKLNSELIELLIANGGIDQIPLKQSLFTKMFCCL